MCFCNIWQICSISKNFGQFFLRNTYFLYPRSLVTFPTKSIWSLFCTLKSSLICKPKGSGFNLVGLLHTGHPLYRERKSFSFPICHHKTFSIRKVIVWLPPSLISALHFQTCCIFAKYCKKNHKKWNHIKNILRTY